MDRYIAGVDIGNSTTETAIGFFDGRSMRFCSSGIARTTGIKGSIENITGIITSLENALYNAGLSLADLTDILINEAAPVIGNVAMEITSETIITESTMIGHNPATPGGIGLGQGITVLLDEIDLIDFEGRYIVVIPSCWDFVDAARKLNESMKKGCSIEGAIVQKDDGVLIGNRIAKSIPVVDEVRYIDRVPFGMEAAVEVAPPGAFVSTLSDPFGIAAVFNLTPDETKLVFRTARALIGKRSAVVIRTPGGSVSAQHLSSGTITFFGNDEKIVVPVNEGAEKIMGARKQLAIVDDIEGEPGTNIGIMLESVRRVMANLTYDKIDQIRLNDLFAVDTSVPRPINGGMAHEISHESAVGLSAMVKTDRLYMDGIARRLREKTGLYVNIEGVEADMAIRGALTTPGSGIPMAVLDLGAGSTDASFIDTKGLIRSVHLAGAGDMVTMLIDQELGLNDRNLAEEIKKYPLARVDSLSHIRHEDGVVEPVPEPLPTHLFGRVIALKPDMPLSLPAGLSLEQVRTARRQAKKKVFLCNTLRALQNVVPGGHIESVSYVILVGGSALDFETSHMVSEMLTKRDIVAGRGNIRSTEGPRNAVATGLLLAYKEKWTHQPGATEIR